MHRRNPPQRTRHRFPRVSPWLSVGLAVAAIAWMVAARPALVKYPTDLDVTAHYKGTFSVLVDPSTAAPLAQPIVLPLTVDRHIEAIGDQSGSSEVVVRETIDERAGDLVDVTQTNVYVMDRSTIENVADERAYAYDPDNVVDRSGAYRVNFPFGTSSERSYTVYQNELETTYQMVPASDPTGELEGLAVNFYTAKVAEGPVTDAYLADLMKAAPLPEALTLDQLSPQLEAAGIDVAALLAALTPVLTPDDAATLSEFAAEPIPLEYTFRVGSGRSAVEPETGALLRAQVDDEVIGARPSMTALPVLQEVLSHYPQVPEAVSTSQALDELAAAPATPVIEISYAQTDESVAEVADVVRDMRRSVMLAEVWVPLALAGGALVSLIVGGAIYLRRRRRGRPAPLPVVPSGLEAPAPTREGELVGTGR